MLTTTGVGKFVDIPQLQTVLQPPSFREIQDLDGNLEGGLWFDKGAEVDLDGLYCIFILRMEKTDSRFWVLLVSPTENHEEYTRIGLGFNRRE
jgi:hypothetical protein